MKHNRRIDRNRNELRNRRKRFNNGDRNPQADEFYEKSCNNKRRYGKARAEMQAKNMQERTGVLTDAYVCRYGDHWHVGRQKTKLSNGIVVMRTVANQKKEQEQITEEPI